MDSPTTSATSAAVPPPPAASPAADKTIYKRHVRNFLINKDYQLKTTATMVVIALVLTTALGWLVNRQTQQASQALDEASANLTEGETIFKVQAETAEAKQAKGLQLKPADSMAIQLYQQFEKQDAVKEQADQIKKAQGRHILIILIVFGVVLTAVLSIIGIVLTHKVAGPLYKTTMYIDRIREGRLGHIYDLRKGDQLRDFFSHFKEMHAALRTSTQDDIDVLERAAGAAPTEVANELKALATKKKQSLD
jgi:methyl-accepting chemotaxis protein